MIDTSAAKRGEPIWSSVMPSIAHSDDRLLSETERQQKYLDRLPSNFDFPLFNSRQALESQRRNGYRHTASAAREIVDNALEAGASEIHVIFERPRVTAPHQRKESVSAVAFIDNGSGMLPKMARYALSWGAGTHFDDPRFIGKFGFGLPNASINQTRRVEVYTKTQDATAIVKAWLDVNEIPQYGLQSIPEPVVAELPEFVQRYLKQQNKNFTHGTVVVWARPDRLTYRSAGSLREHLLDDFGVTYRGRLDGIELTVDGTRVEPVDPLFLDPNARYFVPPENGGAECRLDTKVPVQFRQDRETGELHLRRIESEDELTQPDDERLAVGAIRIRISRMSPSFLSGTKSESLEAHKRFEIRKPRRGMSFVRSGREIETWDAFPRSPRDKASNLGKWPLLQGYAYYWGVEIQFDPALDDVFGITNDKQTVRPIEDFWRVLVLEGVDRMLNDENNWQSTSRRRTPPAPTAVSNGPTPAERAAQAADSATGRKLDVPPNKKEKARAVQEDNARQLAQRSGASYEAALAAIQESAKQRPYKIEYADLPHGPFYEPEWAGSQVVIRINRAHPFYRTLYSDLLELGETSLPKQAADVLLIAFGKGELVCDDPQTQVWYKRQRETAWSSFLADALSVLDRTLRPGHDEPNDSLPAIPPEQVAETTAS